MGRIWKIITSVDDFLGMVLMAFIILLATVNVFMRYVLGSPWGWVEEVTIFTFVWLIMFGAASVIKAEGHCSIDVIARRLPPQMQRCVNIVVHGVTIITLMLMIWYGIKLTLGAGSKVTPMLGIPYTYVDLAIPVGCSLMLMYYVRIFWLDLTGKNQECKLEEQ